jgi:hypothetical protein
MLIWAFSKVVCYSQFAEITWPGKIAPVTNMDLVSVNSVWLETSRIDEDDIVALSRRRLGNHLDGTYIPYSQTKLVHGKPNTRAHPWCFWHSPVNNNLPVTALYSDNVIYSLGAAETYLSWASRWVVTICSSWQQQASQWKVGIWRDMRCTITENTESQKCKMSVKLIKFDKQGVDYLGMMKWIIMNGPSPCTRE